MFELKKKSEDDVKSSASEAFSAYPVIRSFIHDLLRQRPDMLAEVANSLRCFIMLCTVLDRLAEATRDDGVRHVNALRRAIVAHQTAFQSVYGEEAVLPKAHYVTMPCICHFSLRGLAASSAALSMSEGTRN